MAGMQYTASARLIPPRCTHQLLEVKCAQPESSRKSDSIWT